MDKLMIIAGGDWQVPITRKAKELGLYVISSNLYPDSPAFRFADACETADVLDVQTNLSYAEKHHPDAVITDQSDIAVPTVASICQTLGLPGIGTAKAELFTNKYKMREFCKQHGFASPDFCLCFDLEQAEAFLNKRGRMIIKPVDSQSSRGVFIIENLEQLREKFPESMQYSHSQKAVLAEEYIDGTEFTVDGIKTDKEYMVLAVSEKQHYAENPNVASGLFFSMKNDRFDYDALRRTNRELVLAMGLPFGLTHAEYKYQDGKFYLIEIAARGGGTRISSDIVPIMSGVDSNAALIRMALGQDVALEPHWSQERCAVLQFLSFRPGRVKKVLGLEKIRAMPGVDDFGLSFEEGQEILPMHDDRSRQGYYIAYAESRKELLELQKKIEGELQIVYDER